MMRRREFLAGAATLAGVSHAHALGIGKLGVGFGHGGVLGRAGNNAPVLLGVPSGFGWTPSFNLYRTPGGVYSTDFDPNSLIPAVTTTYWVNTVTGNGGNSGLTPSLPKNTLSACLIAANVDQVRLIAAGTVAANGAYIMWGNRGWSAQSPTRSLSVVADDGVSRFISVQSATNAPPTWTKTAGLTNVYQCAAAGSAVNGPTDLKYLDGNGDFVHPLIAANSTAVDATPNSFFYDGSTTLFVQATDSRNLVGDAFMTGITTGQGMAFTTASALTLWVKGIDFVCGQPILANQASAPAGASPIICMVDCTGQGSNANVNGFNFNGKYDVYLKSCRASNNYGDGLGGYHALNSVSGRAFEYNCSTGFNGYLNTSNQSSSVHDDGLIITLNPAYQGAANQCITDIVNAQRWILGGRLGAPVETDLGGNTIQLGANVKMWLDGTIVDPAVTFTLALNGATSVLSYRNNAAIATATKTGVGTLQTY